MEQDAESPTISEFERDLADYIAALKLPRHLEANFQALLSRHDFSAARAQLLTSVPGRHQGEMWMLPRASCAASCLGGRPSFVQHLISILGNLLGDIRYYARS